MPSKKQKREIRAEQKYQDQLEEKKVQEEERSWENGTNKRGVLKSQLQNEKHEEKMRLKQETKELLAQEEEILVSGKKSKSKKSKNDDLFLLNQALSSAPKTKAQIQKENETKAKEERKKQEEDRLLENEERKQRELQEEKEYKYKNIVKQDAFKTIESDVIGTIDDALIVLDFSDEVIQNNNEFKQFYNKQLIILQSENPNLRKNQYKEHIYKLWKRSIENPNNQN
jgi:hypothetical protein